jgi:hypothetical protein
MDVMINSDKTTTANARKRMCAHISCLCSVPDRQEYCGAACRDAGSGDVEIACQCDHMACSLMMRPFGTGSADLQS